MRRKFEGETNSFFFAYETPTPFPTSKSEIKTPFPFRNEKVETVVVDDAPHSF